MKQRHGSSDGNKISLSDLFGALQKKVRTVLATPVVEVGDRGTLRINASSGVNYSAADVLAALRSKEEMTKACGNAKLLN